MLAVLALLSTAFGLECPERLTREDLSTELTKAETAYGTLDTMAFRDRMNGLAGLLLPCMGDLVPPDLAARTHRVMALQQLELGNPTAADAAVAAIKHVDPALPLPPEWLPPEHPLRSAMAAAEAPAFGKAPEPRVGALAFDGTNGRLRPRGVPTIAQVFDASGVAQSTLYLGPEDPLPEYAAIPRRRNTLIAAGSGSLGAGVAMIGMSYLQYTSMVAAAKDPLFPADDLRAMRGSTNLLYLGGASLVGVGFGFGAAAVATGPR